MTDIAPIGRFQPTSLNTTGRTGRNPSPSDATVRGSDQVEVSPAARYLSRLQEQPEVRTEVFERVRQEIASGQYDTPEKIAQAVDNLLEDLA